MVALICEYFLYPVNDIPRLVHYFFQQSLEILSRSVFHVHLTFFRLQSGRDLSLLERRRRAKFSPDLAASPDWRPSDDRDPRWRELHASAGAPHRESCIDPSTQRA